MNAESFYRASRAVLTAIAALCGVSSALAQLNQNCTVSVLNRTVPVNPDGTWVLPNVPANFGLVKARATCVQNGVTVFGESDFFSVPANGAVNLPSIKLGATTPIPASLVVAPSSPSLTSAGQTVQLVVTATYPDGSTKDITAANAGTNYTISNTAIATISPGGLVTAVSSGTVVIQANSDGATAISTVRVDLGGAAVGGIPVSWLIAHGLNPNDPLVPFEDPDRDGLTNLQEFQAGTDPNNPDTDGDGLTDGDEVNKYHTKPLLADTDGDGIPDGVEIQTGTNPLDAKSYDLLKATASSKVTPPSFTLSTSLANPNLSIQLTWKVTLIDGKTTLNLTADPRTTYKSSDLNICSFGGQPGLVFSRAAGACVITISQNTLTMTVPGTVTNFSPSEVSTLNVPGAVAVDVAGNFAYVAVGTSGLSVVDVTDRTKPQLRATLGGLGNAQAVRASAQTVAVADANGFLRIVNAQNPDAPTLVSSLPIAGVPAALALHGTTVAIAAQSGGVSLVNIANPASPTLIAAFAVPAPAIGVDFDPQSGLAAVAMGSSGLQLADISNPVSPKLRGVLAGGDVRRVLLKLPAALLADAQRSVTAVDVSNPDKPVVSSSIPSSLGGVPVDIAAFGNIAITADATFGRAIPIVSIADPLNPSTLTFWPLASPGYSSSVAVDISFGYVIIPATSTLRILKYQDISDTFGIPPVISITSPLPGTTLIQGQTIQLAANAKDDVAVASVNFLVDGRIVSTVASQPYQSSYLVPIAATTLTFGATAVDYGNNVGTAQNVVVPVIPDPLTTATGRVVTKSDGTPVAGATVTAFKISGLTAADGTFSIPGLPTIRGPVVVTAIGVVAGVTLAGTSASVDPVRGGITSVGDIQVGPKPVITSITRKSALAGTTDVSFIVQGANFSGSTFAFLPAGNINITKTTMAADGKSATLTVDIPASAIGTFALVASSPAGSTETAVNQVDRFTSVDPNSTADTDGDGFQDAIEAVFGTDPLDPTSFPFILTATETESVAFSILNAPVTGAGSTEAESVAFSILNAPVTGAGSTETESVTFSILNAPVTGAGSTETESVAFSILNAPVTGAGSTEAESVAFSILNAPITASGILEAGSYFSVLNAIGAAKIGNAQPRTAQPGESRQSVTPPTVSSAPIDPFLDSDGDGLPDWFELLIGTDPYNPDTDGDGLSDFEEIFIYQTNPLLADTDGDGFSDGQEVLFGSDPLNPDSTPLSIRQRAGTVRSADIRLQMIADNSSASKNSIVKGDSHVNAHTNKTGRTKAPAVSRFLGRFAAHRTDN